VEFLDQEQVRCRCCTVPEICQLELLRQMPLKVSVDGATLQNKSCHMSRMRDAGSSDS
jgi:hypothetical protein